MQQEIECKFLNIDHDDTRSKLKKLGAVCEHPMRLMRRVMLDYLDNRFQNNKQQERLRIRDEGDKVTVTYKRNNTTNYAYETEAVVSSFEDMLAVFQSIGLRAYSFQESKRETWHYKHVEIVLDEWPWISPYIEVEGKSEKAIKSVANELGLKWQDAKFGSVDTVYMSEFPGMKKGDSVGDIAEVKFGMELPEYFRERMKK